MRSEAIPADRDHCRRDIRIYLGEASHVREFDISTMSNPGVHDTTTIVRANTFGEQLWPCLPDRRLHSDPKSVVDSACRVFQPRRWTTELVEFRERGLEVCSSKSCKRLIMSPSTVEATIRHSAAKPSCEVPTTVGDDPCRRRCSRCTASM